MKNAAAIEALEARLAEIERKGNALIEVINDLRSEDGLPPRSPLGSGRGGSSPSGVTGPALHSIKSDTFYGKKMQTAVREYLEMRKAAGDGPATPREIFDALKSGGFQTDAKDDNVALVSLRAMMRKRSHYFHKLPNGKYGLTSWYPNAKVAKASTAADDDDDSDDAPESNAADARTSAA